VIGVDSAPEAVDLAARLSSHIEPDRLAYLCADGHHLPFMAGSFDAVICISVLAFCKQLNLMLAELRRLLRPGGRLLIANSEVVTESWGAGSCEESPIAPAILGLDVDWFTC
jgi:ubiquinone/menaquinone biosynthesis C-methylase UbiE